MEGSRLRILNLLQWHNQATVDGLSKHTGLASATVRRHLDILQRNHLVDFRQVKKKTGRPEYSYFLTEVGQESLPKGYDRLLGSLLQELSDLPRDEIGNSSGDELLQLLFQRIAQRTVDSAKDGVGESFTERLAKAVSILQEEQFSPEVEETDSSVYIYLRNCPFRSVALENDSVCGYDQHVLSSVLGTEVVRERCIRENNGSCCYVASKVVQPTQPLSAPSRV